MATTDVSLTFCCGLRGYHVYRTVWTPVLLETLYVIHDSDNVVDQHAIAARKRLPGSVMGSTVEHLPKEISRITGYNIVC